MKKALMLALTLISVAIVAWAADDGKYAPSSEPAVQVDQKWAPEYGEKGELLNILGPMRGAIVEE